MKSVVILYDSNSKYADEKSFGELSAKQICESKVKQLGIEIEKIGPCDSVHNLVSELVKVSKDKEADYLIFSYDDLPFYNVQLTKNMIQNHEEYKSEYTYADGYPYGLSPEIFDSGALEVLQEMAATNQKSEGDKPVDRNSIYNLLKTEINSFEVEAVISDEDWRLLRLAFHCGKKENYLSSVALYNKLVEDKKSPENISADELSEISSRLPEVLKTVPGFYNIQISDFVSCNAIYNPYNKAYEEKFHENPMKVNKVMSYEQFDGLIDKIADFSDTAVVSLSAWGEAFSHKDILKMIEKVLSYEGLSVFIETDGYNVTDELCNQLSEIVNNAKPRTNGWNKIMIAVSLDAASSPMYKSIHKDCDEAGYEKALNAIDVLYKYIPDSVYPQFIRMNENEDELETFFRFWNEKTNHSNGNFIIQKYDDFAGELPPRKPADLSPLERNPCWHLRRDLTILSNGDVPLCRAYVLSNIVGNVFKDDLSLIWSKLNSTLEEHINKKYNEKCGKCDEYYTFNF